ncbi:unnamed protein product [Sphagnum balticum]
MEEEEEVEVASETDCQRTTNSSHKTERPGLTVAATVFYTGASVLPPDTKCAGRAPGCSSLVDINDRCSQQETRLWVGNCSTTQTN